MLTRLGSLSLPYQIATAGVFLVAYVVLEWISFIHEYRGVPVTPWNPGLGVVFALMVLGGPRYGVVLFAGVVIAETTVLQTKLQWPIILGIAAIFATVYGTVAAVARKHLRLDVGLFLDFAGSIQHVDALGEMRPGFHGERARVPRLRLDL